MSRKKLFLILVAMSSVSLLLHHGSQFIWTMKAFKVGCSTQASSASKSTRPKHTSIAFLKTHKTASTTVQNLLFRFAERHNVTVALPFPACDHQFCYPRSFSSRFVHPYTVPPQIITNHMRFNYSEVRRVMPNDTVYITILREPASMFESLFSYYNQYCLSFKRVPNGSLETFMNSPWRYYRAGDKDSMYAHNTLTYDLGGDKDHLATDAAYMKAFIAEIERIFSLVMISEYFDESLVLLRHLLSWDLEDVLYIKLNMRAPSSKRRLSKDLPVKIRNWNALDTKLYDHFNATLWRRLTELGLSCVAKEVQMLRSAQDRLLRGCFGGIPQLRPAAQIKNKELRPWQPSSKVNIVGYDLPLNASYLGKEPGIKSHDLCLKLILPEVQYSQLLLQSQTLRYRKSHPKNILPYNRAGAVHKPHPFQRSLRDSPPLMRYQSDTRESPRIAQKKAM
ncbi:galactose-3-O-sulfotransferase 3-like [Scleropages formosus]|uniref:Galactose-3-O-sulfotransferase 3-like n=2 Tax=Scleropages formosus TaxID=113540 RepID=A0A0P7WQX1_SCLFO|nr:galactose-3-O-sulfotransferase 3 isoform X2 [Scleropages formosus]KPP66019.1 galactose-3-O-sulfotransferase 3-like [Scleropages formosus]